MHLRWNDCNLQVTPLNDIYGLLDWQINDLARQSCGW